MEVLINFHMHLHSTSNIYLSRFQSTPGRYLSTGAMLITLKSSDISKVATYQKYSNYGKYLKYRISKVKTIDSIKSIKSMQVWKALKILKIHIEH